MSVIVKNKGKIDWDKDLDKVFGKKFRGIVAQVIVKGIKDGLNASKDIKGRAFKKLKTKTVRDKVKKGFTTKPLIRTGVMKKLPPVKNKMKHAEISTAKSRSSIAMYHNEGGKHLPQRQWYGVSEDAKIDISRAVAKKVVQILKYGYKLPKKL